MGYLGISGSVVCLRINSISIWKSTGRFLLFSVVFCRFLLLSTNVFLKDEVRVGLISWDWGANKYSVRKKYESKITK